MPSRAVDAAAHPEPAGIAVQSTLVRCLCGPWGITAGVISLLAVHWLIGTTALRNKSTTCDEIAHLVSGCSYWLKNDYRLQPENGNLPQRWHAIPMVLTSAKLPPDNDPAWKTSDVWRLGRSFFYDQGNGATKLLARGRAMAALLSVATCLVVFLWSRWLFGLRGAFISLALAVFCPTMLAHGPLMTSDMCLTLFLLLSTWAIWELLHTISPLRLIGGMLAIAGLFLSKFSAAIILPVALILVVIRQFSSQPLVIQWGAGPLPAAWFGRTEGIFEVKLRLRRQQLAATFVVVVLCGLFAFAAVWAAYSFRYSAFGEGPLANAQFFKLTDVQTASKVVPGRSGKPIAKLADKHVLPEAYLYGAAYVLAHQKRAAFLNGDYSVSGWRHYFLYCFAVKTPLALFGMLSLAIIALGEPHVGRRHDHFIFRRDKSGAVTFGTTHRVVGPDLPYHFAPLGVLFVLYWMTAIGTTLNIGYRHILPIYPLLYIFAGAAGNLIGPARAIGSTAVGCCLALFSIDSLAAYPNYISYFNLLIARSTAYEHLVDSNLDWGQDLPGLARWLKRNNADAQPAPVYLAYFGNGRPSYYGIDAKPLPPDRDKPISFEPGLYCISATTLQAVYEDAPGHWNRAYEEKYQQRRQQFERRNNEDPKFAGAFGGGAASDEVLEARAAYHYGQYLRLLAYLRHRPPTANVGYSILIFRLTADEINEALKGQPIEIYELPWLPQRVKYL